MTQIIGDKELAAKLRRLSDLRFLRPYIQAAVTHVSGKVSAYPSSTDANSPANRRWYERGWGTRYRRKDGSWGGQQTSEDLGPSWKGKATSDTRGIIGNDASYAKWVQGPQQSAIMKKIGWKTTDTVVDEESEKVLKSIQEAVDNELRK